MTTRLVMEGGKVKATLEQLQAQTPGRVRVDWLRFTIPVHALVRFVDQQTGGAHIEGTFPGFVPDRPFFLADDADAQRLLGLVPLDFASALHFSDGTRGYLTPRSLAAIAHEALRQHLGSESTLFAPGQPVEAEESGMDFYAARSPVRYNGSTVGYICAGGRSQNQANTVHYNLFGSACLHITARELEQIAEFIDKLGGWITRSDLCLDVWTGLDVAEVRDAWKAGRFDVRGKRPSQKEHGAWSSGHSRTFEVGARETGKMLRAYEKGDELFGHEVGDPWVRLEVEFRNNHRVLETDILRRPADFFAGAYQYLADFLADLNADFQPCRIPTQSETKDATAQAAVTRVVRWLSNTAGPSLAAVWNLGGDMIAEIIEANTHKHARRLRGFARETLAAAFNQAAAPSPSVCAFA